MRRKGRGESVIYRTDPSSGCYDYGDEFLRSTVEPNYFEDYYGQLLLLHVQIREKPHTVFFEKETRYNDDCTHSMSPS